jgi:hypothetical protein
MTSSEHYFPQTGAPSTAKSQIGGKSQDRLMIRSLMYKKTATPADSLSRINQPIDLESSNAVLFAHLTQA